MRWLPAAGREDMVTCEVAASLCISERSADHLLVEALQLVGQPAVLAAVMDGRVGLGVSASGFFSWRGRPASATALRRADLTDKIEVIFTGSDATYGYRRVHAQLARDGVACGPELVRHLMAERGLVPCQPRPRVNLTHNDGGEHHIPDLLEQNFTATAPGRTLIGDITYIPTWEGWLYLATVIDVHTRMVIGYAMDDNYRTPLISQALRHATANQHVHDGAIFHSDRGSNGGFKWSSQHLEDEGVADGSQCGAADESGGA